MSYLSHVMHLKFLVSLKSNDPFVCIFFLSNLFWTSLFLLKHVFIGFCFNFEHNTLLVESLENFVFLEENWLSGKLMQLLYKESTRGSSSAAISSDFIDNTTDSCESDFLIFSSETCKFCMKSFRSLISWESSWNKEIINDKWWNMLNEI